MTYIIIGLIVILSYAMGGLSTARIVAKSARSLNIYKIGTGLADTENIYENVSKPLGFMVGLIDAVKSYFYLTLIYFFLNFFSNMRMDGNISVVYQGNIMMLYAIGLLIGHCLPLSNNFRGGRGIFTYLGVAAYFTLLPTVITAVVAAFVVFIWNQIRFAQYMIVILPVLLATLFDSFIPQFSRELPPHYVPMAIGMMVVMAVLNFLVSKKLGEL